MTGGRRDDQDELAASLLALRQAAGLDQKPAGEAAGINRTRISRAEHRSALLSDDEIRRLGRVYQADPAEVDRLVTLTKQVRESLKSRRVIFQRGTHHFQARLRRLELEADQVRAFAPTVVLGMLQTAAYAGVVFNQLRGAGGDPERSVVARRKRYADLGDTSRQWTLIQTQAAFEWALGGPTVMVEQLGEIAVAARLPNVRLGVIPTRTPAEVVGLHGFNLHRTPPGWRVMLGTKEGMALIEDASRVQSYLDLFAELETLAVFDEQARELLGRVAQDYRIDTEIADNRG